MAPPFRAPAGCGACEEVAFLPEYITHPSPVSCFYQQDVFLLALIADFSWLDDCLDLADTGSVERGWLGHDVLYHAHNFGPRFPFNPRPGFMTFWARMFGEQIAPLIASVYLLNGDVNAKN